MKKLNKIEKSLYNMIPWLPLIHGNIDLSNADMFNEVEKKEVQNTEPYLKELKYTKKYHENFKNNSIFIIF